MHALKFLCVFTNEFQALTPDHLNRLADVRLGENMKYWISIIHKCKNQKLLIDDDLEARLESAAIQIV